MQKGLKIDGQMRALAMALGGAIVTSVIAMFIPVSVFESITGSTGFSELVPATGAPLGDTARAMIAFGFGALAFAALSAFLLRKPAIAKAPAAAATAKPIADELEDAPSFMERMRGKIGDYVESRRNADTVTELSDLPKLRAGDAHPDAPPRRPISAHRDFGEIVGDAPDVDVLPMTVATEQVLEEPYVAQAAETVEPPLAEPLPVESVPAAAEPATVTHMVARLELAVAERQGQIAKLEALASAEIAKPELVVPTEMTEAETVLVAEPPRQTILEAVPSQPATELVEDDMDAALRSALETLHRMNARTR